MMNCVFGLIGVFLYVRFLIWLLIGCVMLILYVRLVDVNMLKL